ncbi:MAG: TPM domain-containing protein [Pseudomonadota bacterium]
MLGTTAGLGLSFVLTLLSAAPSVAITPAEVPNPRQENSGWVTDMADMLSSGEEAELNQLISELEATEGHEIAVVTVPDTQPSATPKAFTTELFNSWGIGKEGEDNGVLFVVSKGDRRTEIEVGYGLEATLPDAKVGEILRSRITPEFKQGNFNTGILNGTQALVTVLNGDTLAPVANTAPQPVTPKTYSRKRSTRTDDGGHTVFLLMILGVGGLWALCVASGNSNGSGSSGDSNYYGSNDSYSSHNNYSSGGGYSGGSDFGGGDSGGGGGGDSW